MKREELKPCPFCGAEAERIFIGNDFTKTRYVLIGTALQFGIADKLEACFDEVHRSNMSKLGNDGKPIRREDGKVMKGENFKRPDLKRVLNEPVATQQQPTAEGADWYPVAKRVLNGFIDNVNTYQDGDELYIKYDTAIEAMREFELSMHEQPTAEGAEEIFRECFAEEAVKRGDVPLSDEKWNDLVKESGGFMFRAMKRFATLHAQRIAEKMVSERLREELIAYKTYENIFDNRFTTVEDLIDEYLKTQENEKY